MLVKVISRHESVRTEMYDNMPDPMSNLYEYTI